MYTDSKRKQILPVLYHNKSDCCGCKACANVCPADAISFFEDECGFFYPSIDAEKCVGCRKCINTCDFQKEDGGVHKSYPKHCYAAVHKDKTVLKNSSSGGVFTALADIVLEKGGVVFGCAFDENLNPQHRMAESREQFAAMLGSKYVQSDVGTTYRQVKEFLEESRTVLYTGTPCQIAGLLSFLGDTNTDHLITAELVCHGVPSNKLFHQYISYLEKKNNTRITDYHFRSKEKGWGIRDGQFDQTFVTQNGKKVVLPGFASVYISSYRKNDLHRSSCYQCPYATPLRMADFTMGDFWGFNNANVQSGYKRGLSIFLANTEKAETFRPDLEQRLNLEEVHEIEAAIHTNGNLYRPSPKGEQRELVMRKLADGTLETYFADYENRQAKALKRERLKRLVPIPVYLTLKKIKHGIKK